MAKRAAHDSTQPVALLEQAIDEAIRQEEDSEAYWAAVTSLRAAGPTTVWALVAPLASDARPQVRALVPDVLRYFDPHPLRDETVALLAEMLSTESEASVLESIALAFVDLRDVRAQELLPAFLKHSEPRVRNSALHGLLTVVGANTARYFVQASSDDDSDVRNWATFGLRLLLEDAERQDVSNNIEALDALVARLDDQEAEVRAEAVLGLAGRGDRRAIPSLKKELGEMPDWNHFLEAAERFADPELHPLLKALLEKYPEERASLQPAIDACEPRARNPH